MGVIAKCWRRLSARIRSAIDTDAAVALIHDTPYIWRALAVGGGGAFDTPPLKRRDAILYVLSNGAHELCTVDDNLKLIIYRYRR